MIAPTPRISVIICTFNRAELLSGALQSVVEQSLEKELFEVVVVDNASTDSTSAVVRTFQSQYACPAVILISESTQGLGYARNAGYKNARGKYVAFMDDDCRAPRDWLKSVLVCFESVNPEPWSVGGPIIPMYDSPKPKWFKDEYERTIWGEEARLLRQGEGFYGSNMAFKRSRIEQYGGFDLQVDMTGVYLSVGGETALFERMWQAAGASCRFYYCPQASMYHRIAPHRMTISYRLKRAFAEGQAWYRLHAPKSVGERFYMLMRVTAALIWYGGRAMMCARPVPSWGNWVVEAIGPLAFCAGRAAGFWGLLIAVREREGK